MAFTLCSRGQKQKDGMGEEHGVAMEVERQSSVLITDPPTGNRTRGVGSSREETQLRWGKDSIAWELSWTDILMTDQPNQTMEAPFELLCIECTTSQLLLPTDEEKVCERRGLTGYPEAPGWHKDM